MNCRKTVLICCVILLGTDADVLEGKDGDQNNEMVVKHLENGTVPSSSSSPSSEVGPADSHETMNNREINPKIREKRSYEFLMGLINNNSKYELTKVEPAALREGKSDIRDKPITNEQIQASELLLELMVRIAAHPDQWEKVHNILQKLNADLKTSKSVVQEMQNRSQINVSKKQILANISKSNTTEKAWPTFEPVNINNKAKLSSWQTTSNNNNKYSKNFAYHRVTGKPSLYLNKKPKAYIAVSVIAPKPIANSRTPEDEGMLENELQQLKPWSHQQNLENMARLRARWVIQTEAPNASAEPKL